MVITSIKRYSKKSGFLISTCILFKELLSDSIFTLDGNSQISPIPSTSENIEMASPKRGEKFRATTFMPIINRLEKIKTSAQDFTRSVFGVKTSRKYPHAATAQPLVYPPINNPNTHKTEGAKKKRQSSN